jgi:hypothetical protein
MNSVFAYSQKLLKRCVVTVQAAVGTWEVEAYEWENVVTVT